VISAEAILGQIECEKGGKRERKWKCKIILGRDEKEIIRRILRKKKFQRQLFSR
jgi:hypothetical protein